MDLDSLRHTAKEVLAASVCAVFPKVQLVGGGIDEIGFYYDFLFPKEILTVFSERELRHIEDQMILMIHQDHPIKVLEMMRENGARYLEHLGQPLRKEAALEAETNIVSLIEMGLFRDLCPHVAITQTSEIKAFKLQGFKLFEGRVRISGTVFPDKQQLKTFLKRYKEAAKRDPFILGSKENYFLLLNEEWVFLPKGERLLERLKKYWLAEHVDIERITFSDASDRQEVHETVMALQKRAQIASYSLLEGDLVSFNYRDDQELSNVLISSLHFFQKAIKIFPFESRVYCLEPESGRLSKILHNEGVDHERERSKEESSHLILRVEDGYGRKRTLSYIKVERNKKVLHRSLFYSPNEWVAHMIEMGVKI
ncbi:MAG: hypothetical protein S4CHLAM2_06180 [Chlamydiales bacterium]|nr:hypothetical protein [Chlamydiales bacterium]